MKAKRRADMERVVVETVAEVTRRRMPPRYHTVDVVVAVENGPFVIAFAIDPTEFNSTGHATVDLTKTPFKVVDKVPGRRSRVRPAAGS